MRLIICLFLLIITASSQAQIAPFVDFNGYFRTFYMNNFRQIEFQRIQSFQAGDNLVAYIDNRGDFKVYDGENKIALTNMNVEYKMSDFQLAWNIGPGIFYLDKGEKKLLTTFGRNYAVSDSLIVFEDTRFNTVNAVYQGNVYPLYQVTGELYMPEVIGDNIIAFRDNGDFYKVFWRGKIYDLGVWMQGITFNAGTDMLTFNDPTHRTFAIFENGEFLDVETFFVKSYKSGRGFAVYEDLNGNLWHYKDGTKTALTNFSASFWEVKDDIVVWGENTMVYTFSNGEKTRLTTYMPKDYQLKNNVFAFRNLMGGVSVFMNGKLTELTNQPDAIYAIYGNLVLVELFNKSFLVFKDGKKFEA
ncbi:MAG: hypothetical protein E6Q37_01165 [Crocinitomicaceae bacterium]|nr:MAG: hypothetical protein E6Q37_01165 [Crocinitomicaceae bacterium]